MSDFVGEGFKPFPSTYFDNKHIGEVTEWPDERIEHMVVEYWAFLDRADIQPRARTIGKRVLEHLGFEMDSRYGDVSDIRKVEDEVCA